MASVTLDLSADVDRMDSHAFASHFSGDCRLRIGSGEPLVGRAAIEAGLTGFFSTIKGLHHDLITQWDVDGVTISEWEVTYRRLDDRQITVPAVTICRGGELIDDYRIFIDLVPVFA